MSFSPGTTLSISSETIVALGIRASVRALVVDMLLL